MSSSRKVSEHSKAMGTYLRERREKAGLTQQDLADRLECQQPAIARLESGGVSPNLTTLRRIAEALDLRLELRMVSREEAFNTGAPFRMNT